MMIDILILKILYFFYIFTNLFEIKHYLWIC